MKTRLTLAVAVLAVLSALSPALACPFHAGQMKSSDACPVGQAWNAAQQACAPNTTS